MEDVKVVSAEKYFEELEEVERAIAGRREEYGIEYYVPHEKQYRFHRSLAKRILYVGGNRCLGGEAEIYDPVARRVRVVRDIVASFSVYAWNGEKLVIARASNPFVKGWGKLYRVRLERGGELVCSGKHRVLTPSGFVSVSELRAGSTVSTPSVCPEECGTALSNEPPLFFRSLECMQQPERSSHKFGSSILGRFFSGRRLLSQVCRFLPTVYALIVTRISTAFSLRRTSEALFPLTLSSNGQSCEGISSGYQYYYRFLSRFCGGQLPVGLSTASGVSPLQDDVHGHTAFFHHERRDDLDNILKHSPSYPVASHLSTEGDCIRRYSSVSPDDLVPPQDTSVVKDITYVRDDFYYDLTVPVYHNYQDMSTMLSANSGKTEAAVAEVVMQTTGWYADWGEEGGKAYRYPDEKRSGMPMKVLWISPQFEHILKFVEPKFNKLLPKSAVIRRPKRNSDGSLKHMEVRHASGGVSVIDFASQEQPLMAFEGSDYDLVVADEPLLRTIFTSVTRGLVDRGGRMIMVFTPITEQWIKEELCDKADGKFIDLFTADIMDNLFDIKGKAVLTKKNIKEFEALLSEDEKETRLRGRWYHMSGMVYKELDIGTHVCRDHTVPKDCPIWFILDPHDRNPHWGIWVYMDKTEDVFVCGEMILHGEPKEYTRAVLFYENDHKWRVKRRIIDPNFGNKPKSVGSNIRVIDQFRASGMKGLILANDDQEAGKMRVRTALKFDKMKPVGLTNRPKLYFMKNAAKQSYRSLSNFQYDDWTKKNQDTKSLREKTQDKNKHISDCLVYFYNSRPRYEQIKVKDDIDKPIY